MIGQRATSYAKDNKNTLEKLSLTMKTGSFGIVNWSTAWNVKRHTERRRSLGVQPERSTLLSPLAGVKGGVNGSR
jgi:hypothetical protein